MPFRRNDREFTERLFRNVRQQEATGGLIPEAIWRSAWQPDCAQSRWDVDLSRAPKEPCGLFLGEPVGDPRTVSLPSDTTWPTPYVPDGRDTVLLAGRVQDRQQPSSCTCPVHRSS